MTRGWTCGWARLSPREERAGVASLQSHGAGFKIKSCWACTTLPCLAFKPSSILTFMTQVLENRGVGGIKKMLEWNSVTM